jgi:hypothetical protein
LKGQQKNCENLRFEGSRKAADNAIVESQRSPEQPKRIDPDQDLTKCNPLTLNECLLFLDFQICHSVLHNFTKKR